MLLYAAGPSAARRGRPVAWSRLAAGQSVPIQPVPDRIAVDPKLAGNLGESPDLPGHAVDEVRPEAGKAELLCTDGELLVGGAAALTGAADLR